MTAHRHRLRPYLAAALTVLAAVSSFRLGYYGNEILTEVAAFAILAMALDLVAGFAGMVSLGHAAYFAVGAYAMAALCVFADWPALAALPVAILAAAVVALVTGALAVRLTGVFFIMITLAIGQMVYSYLFKNRTFGGDDGMSGIPRVELGWLGANSDDPVVFSLVAITLVVLVYLLLITISHSPYGQVLIGIHQNENRMRALGCPVRKYKLAAFTLSGAIAGLAGALIAQLTGFISPDLAFWTVSGEVLIMVIVGGIGTVIGPVVGAAVVIGLKHQLSSITEYWTFVMGVFFVIVVLFTEGGFYGLLVRLRDRFGSKPKRHRRAPSGEQG